MSLRIHFLYVEHHHTFDFDHAEILAQEKPHEKRMFLEDLFIKSSTTYVNRECIEEANVSPIYNHQFEYLDSTNGHRNGWADRNAPTYPAIAIEDAGIHPRRILCALVYAQTVNHNTRNLFLLRVLSICSNFCSNKKKKTNSAIRYQ